MNEIKSVKLIDLSRIKPNRNQPRKVFDEISLKELSESIKSYGVIQPISLRRTSEEEYEIIAGERRYRAAELAGLEKIPSIIIEINEDDSAVVALIENLQREDLNFIEEAESYAKLLEIFKITQIELAQKIGKKQSTVANKLRILKLPILIKDILINENLSERHGRALLRIDDEKIQNNIIRKIVKNKLTVKETEKLIDDIIIKYNNKSKEQKLNIKKFINYRIYVNTIKHAYKEILKTGISAEFEQNEFDDYIELKVKIPKNNI